MRDPWVMSRPAPFLCFPVGFRRWCRRRQSKRGLRICRGLRTRQRLLRLRRRALRYMAADKPARMGAGLGPTQLPAATGILTWPAQRVLAPTRTGRSQETGGASRGCTQTQRPRSGCGQSRPRMRFVRTAHSCPRALQWSSRRHHSGSSCRS